MDVVNEILKCLIFGDLMVVMIGFLIHIIKDLIRETRK